MLLSLQSLNIHIQLKKLQNRDHVIGFTSLKHLNIEWSCFADTAISVLCVIFVVVFAINKFIRIAQGVAKSKFCGWIYIICVWKYRICRWSNQCFVIHLFFLNHKRHKTIWSDVVHMITQNNLLGCFCICCCCFAIKQLCHRTQNVAK